MMRWGHLFAAALLLCAPAWAQGPNTAPTAPPSANNTQIANTLWTNNAIATAIAGLGLNQPHSANTFNAGPCSGAAAVPTYRSLCSGDLDAVFGSTQGMLLERSASGWAGLNVGAANTVLTSNGASADPSYTGVSALLDAVFGATRGSLLERGASGWGLLVPSATAGQVLTSQGTGADPTYTTPVAGTLLGIWGRATYATHTPVMTTSVAAATTIFYDCYDGGGTVLYFNGTSDQSDPITSCEVSTALQSTGTGVLNASNVFDLWWVHSGANRICVATDGAGHGWGGTGDTGGGNAARSTSTGYSALDIATRSYATNKNALTHCYNGSTDYGSVSANQASYLATFATTSSAGQTAYVFAKTGTAGTQTGNLLLWNAHRRKTTVTTGADSTPNWVYAIASVRIANGAASGNGINFVLGQAEESVSVVYNTMATLPASSTAQANIGICLDCAASPAYDKNSLLQLATGSGSQNVGMSTNNSYNGKIGLHVALPLESDSASMSFNGDPYMALTVQLRN
jgi:hypothetical protein